MTPEEVRQRFRSVVARGLARVEDDLARVRALPRGDARAVHHRLVESATNRRRPDVAVELLPDDRALDLEAARGLARFNRRAAEP
jgi:hypothetical protein